MLSTPVTLALLSLAGVLGGSLMTNWDKVFRSDKPAAPAASTTAAAAPGMGAQLQGIWLSDLAQHPYQRERRFRLRLELFAQPGQELSGRVGDVAEGGGATLAELPMLKAGAEGLDFQLESSWCCEGGQTRPYQIFYQVRPGPHGQLLVTRRNNAPGGGQLERFTLVRGA